MGNQNITIEGRGLFFYAVKKNQQIVKNNYYIIKYIYCFSLAYVSF